MDTLFPWLRELTLGLVLGWLLLEALGRGRRGFVLLPLLSLSALLAWRGLSIGFLPLTNKYEAFLGFAEALLLVTALRYGRTGRAGRRRWRRRVRHRPCFSGPLGAREL